MTTPTEADFDNATRVRLRGGRNVHSMVRTASGFGVLYRTGCWSHYIGPGNHLLPPDTAITCRTCARREANR